MHCEPYKTADQWGSEGARSKGGRDHRRKLMAQRRAHNRRLLDEVAEFLRSGIGDLKNPVVGFNDEYRASSDESGHLWPHTRMGEQDNQSFSDEKCSADQCNIFLWEKEEYAGREELLVNLLKRRDGDEQVLERLLRAFLNCTRFAVDDRMTSEERKVVMTHATNLSAQVESMFRSVEAVENPLYLLRSADDEGAQLHEDVAPRTQMLADFEGLSLRLWHHATTENTHVLTARLLLQRDGGVADFVRLQRYHDLLGIGDGEVVEGQNQEGWSMEDDLQQLADLLNWS